MNKTIAYMGVLLVMIASVFAQAADQGIGNPNEECKDFFGVDSDENPIYYGVAKFEWENGAYELSEEGIRFPYNISIDGDNTEADWTSKDYSVQALVKAGQNTEEQGDYGTSGTVTAFGGHAISHVTFCAMNGGGGGGGSDDPSEVPEFSTITLGLAILGAGLGLVFLRKQH